MISSTGSGGGGGGGGKESSSIPVGILQPAKSMMLKTMISFLILKEVKSLKL